MEIIVKHNPRAIDGAGTTVITLPPAVEAFVKALTRLMDMACDTIEAESKRNAR